MKQHITEEQLDELNQSEKHKLGLWCYEHKYFCVLRVTPPGKYGSISDLKTGKHWMIDKPLLSIGQMIEFLDEKKKTILFINKIDCYGDLIWSTGSLSCPGNRAKTEKEGKELHNKNRELCDALWEAVKGVLEQ